MAAFGGFGLSYVCRWLLVYIFLCRLRLEVSDMKKEWLSCREVAVAMNVHPRTVQAWARDGKVPAKKFGQYWRVHRSVIENEAA